MEFRSLLRLCHGSAWYCSTTRIGPLSPLRPIGNFFVTPQLGTPREPATFHIFSSVRCSDPRSQLCCCDRNLILIRLSGVSDPVCLNDQAITAWFTSTRGVYLSWAKSQLLSSGQKIAHSNVNNQSGGLDLHMIGASWMWTESTLSQLKIKKVAVGLSISLQLGPPNCTGRVV